MLWDLVVARLVGIGTNVPELNKASPRKEYVILRGLGWTSGSDTGGAGLLKDTKSTVPRGYPTTRCRCFASVERTQTVMSLVQTPLETARAYAGAGLAVIPIKLDGSKRPSCGNGWELLGVPDEQDLDRWFGGYQPAGMGVICGAGSGGLELIDFDDDAERIFPEWCALVEAEAPGLVAQLCVCQTPREPSGRHVRYRLAEGLTVPGSHVLARPRDGDGNLIKGADGKALLYIETRGTGGQGLVPGGNLSAHETGRPYVLLSGDLCNLPVLDAASWELLMRCAESFDQPAPGLVCSPHWGAPVSGGVRPGDDFNTRAEWAEILETHGWTAIHTSGAVTYWRRPGKAGNCWSATTGYCHGQDGRDLMRVFTTATAGLDGGQAYSRFAVYTYLNHAGDFSAAARDLAARGYGQQTSGAGGRSNRQPPPVPPAQSLGTTSAPVERVQVWIDSMAYRVGEETVKALADLARDVYQRNGLLTRIRGKVPDGMLDWLDKGYQGPVLETIIPTALKMLMSRYVDCVKAGKKEGEGPMSVLPPDWLVGGICAGGVDWAGVPYLLGVTTAPVLRQDGSVNDAPGYDHETATYYRPATGFVWPGLPPVITAADANTAAQELLAVVADFPFVGPAHQSAWLAGLLTLVCRHLIHGPTPLFLMEANIPAAGKGMLCHAACMIALGHTMAASNLPDRPDELDKRLTAMFLSGMTTVLFDNLTGEVKSGLLDMILTGPTYNSRVLGGSKLCTFQNNLSLFATANNLVLGGDLPRRVLPCKLVSSHERPEDRTDFAQDDLLGFVSKNRARLLQAALSIVAGYLRAGMPTQKVMRWGSYERFTALVSSALVWAGQPDPVLSRDDLRKDPGKDQVDLAGLLDGWRQMDPAGCGMTVGDCLRRLSEDYSRDCWPEFRDTLCSMFDLPMGRLPTPRALGMRIRGFQHRVCGGFRFASLGTRQRATIWSACPILSTNTGQSEWVSGSESVGEPWLFDRDGVDVQNVDQVSDGESGSNSRIDSTGSDLPSDPVDQKAKAPQLTHSHSPTHSVRYSKFVKAAKWYLAERPGWLTEAIVYYLETTISAMSESEEENAAIVADARAWLTGGGLPAEAVTALFGEGGTGNED